MKKLVITQEVSFNEEQWEELRGIVDVTYYEKLADSADDWFNRCVGADIIITGKYGLRSERVYDLKDVLIVVPFVGVGFLDKARLTKNHIQVSYAPGCNKRAVSEWIIAMLINLTRELPYYISNRNLPRGQLPKETFGLEGKKVLILGKGNIGTMVGDVCGALGMKITYLSAQPSL